MAMLFYVLPLVSSNINSPTAVTAYILESNLRFDIFQN
jgi:hypothetical protein